MKKLSSILALAAAVAVVPSVSHAAEIVEFGYKASELSTPASQAALLERIELYSKKACKRGSPFAPISAVKECTSDLKSQLVDAIGDPELQMLAEQESEVFVRTARK